MNIEFKYFLCDYYLKLCDFKKCNFCLKKTKRLTSCSCRNLKNKFDLDKNDWFNYEDKHYRVLRLIYKSKGCLTNDFKLENFIVLLFRRQTNTIWFKIKKKSSKQNFYICLF